MIQGSIISDYNEAYLIASGVSGALYEQCLDDMRFFLSRQWTEEELGFLKQSGRYPYTMNVIAKNIRMISGYQRVHQLSSIVLPQHIQYQKEADELSSLLQYAFHQGNAYKVLADGFESSLIAGMSLVEAWVNYDDDVVNGDICFSKTPWSGFVLDPYFTQLNLSDCQFVIKRKYLSFSQALALVPHHEEHLGELSSYGGGRDSKFPWLPFNLNPSREQLLAYDEYYRQEWESQKFILNPQNGETLPWKGKEEDLFLIRQLWGEVKVIKKPVKVLEKHIIINDRYFETVKNPWGLNEYPFVLMGAFFTPEADLYQDKIQSAIRVSRDAQKLTNRVVNQMVDITESQINSGWIVQDGAVVDPQSLYFSGQGRVIFTTAESSPGALQKIQPSSIPPSFFQFAEMAMGASTALLGLNESNFGVADSGQESGLMMMLRQGSAINNIQGLFDNLREAQNQLAEKTLKLIQTWSPNKVAQILGHNPSSQFYSGNFIKYKLSVQEGLLTATQKQLRFRQLVDLYTLTRNPATGLSPITPDILIREAPMVGSSDIQQQILEAQQQQQQGQMLQEQFNTQLKEAQLENIKAGSLEKVALSKERLTRSFSNLGLLNERASKAVDDSAKAVLNRAEALQKLQSLDDSRLMRYLEIIERLETLNQSQREQITREDVQLAQQIGVGESQQQEMTNEKTGIQ